MAYRSSSQAGFTAGTTTFTGTMPSGVVAGDQLLAMVSQDGSGWTYTQSGATWTQLDRTDITGPDTQTISLWARVATGTDALTLTTTGTINQTAVTMVALSGRTATATPNFVRTTPNTSSNASPVSISLTGITAASGDDLVAWAALDGTADTVSWSMTGPGSMTIRQNCLPVNQWSEAATATADNVSSGATGSLAFTATGTGGHAGWSGYVVNLASASANVTVALTGKAATFTAGTLIPSSALALTGQQSIFTAGNVGGTDADALVGVSAIFSAGIVTPNITVGLTGQAATFISGTVVATPTFALTGQSATYAAGSVSANIDIALTGQLATFTTGQIGVQGDVTVALTGQAAIFTAGSLIASGGDVAITVVDLGTGGAGFVPGMKGRKKKEFGPVMREGQVFGEQYAISPFLNEYTPKAQGSNTLHLPNKSTNTNSDDELHHAIFHLMSMML